jgi:transposase
MGGRYLAALEISEAERVELTSLALRRTTAQALALRARIVLGCAEGDENRQVAARLGVSKNTVGKWRRRFAEHRLEGLRDEPRSGTPRTLEDARIEAVIVRTLESLPPDATLEFAQHGQGQRRIDLERSAHLARLRPAAAPAGDLQAVHRPRLRRQGARRRRPLCLAA